MKSILLLAFLCLQSLSYSQIAFEEINSPVDFNISAVRKSPTGEYFVQAMNDKKSIYTSLNGEDWTKSSLPMTLTMEDIQFFSDGTPLLQAEGYEHLIRRNGSWYTMNFSGGWTDIEASFIKEDTLFVFQDDMFAYSLDKGKTFKTLFTAAESIVDHTAHLWKFDHYFVLHHTAGASDHLSIFNEEGDRISIHALDISSAGFIYNSCGEIFIYDYPEYYLLKEQGLIFQTGALTNIHPQFSSSSDLMSQDGNFYLRAGNTIYKTTGCNFTWETVISNDFIKSEDNFWINQQGDIILYNTRSNYFIEQANGTNVWEEQKPNINYALVSMIDESAQKHQISVTSNGLFNKNTSEANWIKLDSIGSNQYRVQYSPDGDLYVNRGTDILYSKDDGHSFSTIQLPDGGFPNDEYTMTVLDDDILFILGGILGGSYYTLNNGKDWIAVYVSFFFDVPQIKLVDNYILIADLDYEYVVTKINLGTNEMTSEDLGDFFALDYYGSVIQDDGTIYFQAFDANGAHPDGLYRYRFGEGLEFLGPYQELAYIYSLASSGNDLYAFNSDEYYLFDGETLTTHSYSGLPSQGSKNFIISENEYLYVIVDNHRIFRSTRPLSYPQYITGSIYQDSNKDCVLDTSDATLKYWQVKVESNTHLRLTNSDSHGHFKFSVPQGDYTVSSRPINSNWELCASSYNISIDENNTNVNQDFLAKGLTDCAELEIDFSTPLLRRCFDNYYSVRVRNTGPEVSAGTILTVELDPFFEFISATIPYT
ncbi:MAG: hypothetical protein WBP41_19585, partial [Saprospiraceae bacterium]